MPRAGLDPESVTEAAAAIVDGEGRAALTLARLASELGVAPPSLYKHVGGLHDLNGRIAALAIRRLADRLTAAALGRSGREALRAIADAHPVDAVGLRALIGRAPRSCTRGRGA